MNEVIIVENKRTFCVNCDEKTEHEVKTRRVELTARGVTFSYVEQYAVCAVCGEEKYVGEVSDANIAPREEAYRKAAGLITVEQIGQILEKYNIGAGPLAKLLGFGDVTINRYVGGQLPSKAHSDLLKEVLSSHDVMGKYLEENKDRITSVAYAKCRAAVNKISVLYGRDKIALVARYMLHRAEEVTPMVLQKLLYFAQAFFRALYRTDLFTDDCQAWAYGPVYPDIYRMYSDCGWNPISMPAMGETEDFSEFTTREIVLMNAVADIFGMYSGGVLSRITHNERPWIETRGNLLPNDRSAATIDKKLIDDYFKKVVEKYQIINPCDISRYCDDMVAKLR